MLEVEAAEEVEVEAGAFIGAEEAVHIKFPSSSAAFVDVDDEDDALEFFIIQFASFGFLFLRLDESDFLTFVGLLGATLCTGFRSARLQNEYINAEELRMGWNL